MKTKPIILDSTPDNINSIYVVTRHLDVGHFSEELKSRIDSVWFNKDQAEERVEEIKVTNPKTFTRIISVTPNEKIDLNWIETFDQEHLKRRHEVVDVASIDEDSLMDMFAPRAVNSLSIDDRWGRLIQSYKIGRAHV